MLKHEPLTKRNLYILRVLTIGYCQPILIKYYTLLKITPPEHKSAVGLLGSRPVFGNYLQNKPRFSHLKMYNYKPESCRQVYLFAKNLSLAYTCHVV